MVRNTTTILRAMAQLLVIQFFSLSLFANENIPQPLVDPLGGLDLYSKVEYSEAKSRTFRPSSGTRAGTVNIGGDQWVLETPSSGSIEADRQAMSDYLMGLGADFFEGTGKQNELHAKVKEPGNGDWWVSINFGRDTYRLTVTLVRTLRNSQDISIEFGGDKRRKFIFYTESDGKHYQTLSVEVPPSHVEIGADMDQEPAGQYVRRVRYDRILKQSATATYTLADIPQESGRFKWTVTHIGDEPTGMLKLKLHRGGDLPVIPPTGEVGSILVKNISNTIMYADPEGAVRFEHPDVQPGTIRGDILPNGDALLMAPPGFWKLFSESPRLGSSRMIPVKPGKQTVVHWPNYLNSAVGSGTQDTIEVTGIEVGEHRGFVAFNLLGDEAGSTTPGLGEVTINEGGQESEVLSIEPISIPPDVVLLLDSSGSMKGQMTTALDATRAFIKSLPDDSRVRIVDFDTQAKVLLGEDKHTVLASLETVKANGATALYDTAIHGMGMLSTSKRPTLILFTDGVDANWDDSGPGSKATQEDLFEAAGAADIPVFCIGFGQGHDQDTLSRLSSLSGGMYFSADEPDVLARTFGIIRDSVVKGYELTYKRPAKPQLSDVPVVQLVLDRSGSMSEEIPSNNGVSRRNTLHEIMRDFIISLSPDTLVSVQSFDAGSVIEQVATRDKDLLLRSIAMIESGGGTDVLKATQSAFESLRAIPSTHRYMVLVTDAAMSIGGEKLEQFDTLLNKFRDENIRTFWMGIGIDPAAPQAQDSFKHAAELSGGRYVVSEDAEEIKNEFTALTQSMNSTALSATSLTSLRLDFEHRKANGKVAKYSAARLVEVPTLLSAGERAAPDEIRYEFTDMPPRYDREVSSMLVGDEPPGVESIVEKRIALDVESGNKAISLRALEAIYLSRLKGAQAPDKTRFLALTLELTNILREQDVVIYPDGSNHPASWTAGGAGAKGRVERRIPAYLIPDLQRHLYLRHNDELTLPVSAATWLAETPLMMPGEQVVVVKPGEVVRGSVVFMVPDEPVTQNSLHLYDINYGHLDLALVGEFSAGLDIEELPVSKPVRLSDAFSIAWLGYDDVGAIGDAKAPEGTVFRIIEASLQSNVQALLAINPFDRFALRLTTEKGDLQFALHQATTMLPLGFFQQSMMTPGSANRIRMAFQVPTELAGRTAGRLVVDLKGDRVVVEPPRPDKTPATQYSPGSKISGDGISIVVNQTGRLDRVGRNKGPWYLADVTIFDEKDGEATRIGQAFELFSPADSVAGDDFAGLEAEKKKGLGDFGQNDQAGKDLKVPVNSKGGELLAGFTTTTVIPDGSHRRGVLLFRIPSNADKNANWKLKSTWISGLDSEVAETQFQDATMLLASLDMRASLKKTNEQQLKDALAREVISYRAKASEKPGRHSPLRVGLAEDVVPGRQIPVPSFVTAGAKSFKSIGNLETLRDKVAGLGWLPDGRDPWAYQQSPEGVLTQAWGTESEFARMAEVVLSRQGFLPERDVVAVTDSGRARLASRANLREVSVEWLPALRYRDSVGETHLLVAPFMEDAANLQNLVEDPAEKPKINNAIPVRLYVIADVVSNAGDRLKRKVDMANALAGGQGDMRTRERYLFNTTLDREALSRGALDIIYVKGEDDKGSFYSAMLEYPGGQVAGKEKVYSSQETIVKLRVQVKFDTQRLEHVRPMAEGETVTGIFHTLGLNLPDLPAAAAAMLEDARQNEHQAGPADDLSALRWYTHGTIARFIAGQTLLEKQASERLGLVTGRTKTPRMVVMTMSRAESDQPLKAAIDLRQVVNDVHSGGEDAQRAYRIMTGLQVSQLEQTVLGERGYGTFGLWAKAPLDSSLIWISPRNKRDIVQYLRALSYPEAIVSSLEKTRNFVLFPTWPTVINSQKRWGWLEVNPKTYETITVLDNGQYGAMVEWDIQNWFSEAQLHMFGAMLGVSTSIWGVSIFSLQTDNYEEIRQKAEALARGIGASLADFNGLRTSGAFDAALMLEQGPSAPGGGGSGGVTVSGEVSFDTFGGGSVMDRFEGKIKLGQDMVGFGQGFSAGVDYYFKN